MMRRSILILLAAVVCGVTPALGHDVPVARVDVEVSETSLTMLLRFDAASYIFGEHIEPALAERILNTPLDKVAEGIVLAERDFARYLEIWVNGERIEPRKVEFPSAESALAAVRRQPPALLGVSVEADIPANARRLEIVLPEELVHGSVAVMRDGQELAASLVRAGVRSDPLPMAPPEPPPPPAPQEEVELPLPPSAWRVAWQYLVLGFEHILPLGLDHILFVLGLFLLSPKMGPLLWQVSAFTVAHTVTLALAVLGVVSIPASLVEPLIALSIAFIAVENLFTSKLKPWRPFVVFAFGLLHGLGVGGVLMELGLPRDQFVTALVSFNVGVELGQLAVILLAFAAVGWWRNRRWYRPAIIVPASCCIALVGLYWTVERILQ